MNPALFVHAEWTSQLAATTFAVVIAVAAARWIARRRAHHLLGARPLPRGHLLRSDLAVLIAFAAIALALLGPRYGERTVQVPATGVDVVILLDVSRSMDAADVPPSRLDRARRATVEILTRLAPADRAALAAFAGRGVLLTPLTPDRNALIELLSGLDTDLIQPASSRLGAGVRAAIAAFEIGSERPRVVFVVGDGENPASGRDVAVADAARARVRVVTAALGTEIGSGVPDGGRALRDADGRMVVTRRRAERFAALAAATGGESFLGDEWGRFDLEHATAAIRRGAAEGAKSGESVSRRIRAVRVAPFAALAFALLLVEGLPLPHRLRWRAAAALIAAIAALAPAVLGTGESAAASERTDSESLDPRAGSESEDARRLIDLGLAHLERGRTGAAAQAFLAAAVYAREPEVAAVAHYDLGVAALAAGDVAGARDAFFDALAADPTDGAARFNLEWTLGALDRQPPTPPGAMADSETDDSAESRADTPEPSPARRSAPPELARAAETGSLDADQRRRWLERTMDDPTPWLRSLARNPDGDEGRPEEPAW